MMTPYFNRCKNGLSAVLCSCVLAFTAHATAQTSVVPAGAGTSGNPYQIAELGNLVWMGESAQVAASSGKFYMHRIK